MEQKYIQQFKRGALEMILLCLIAEKETCGYEIITELNRRGGGVLGYAREGTVYPILYRLEESGLLGSRLDGQQSGGSGTRKFYSITKKGREAMEELVVFWKSYAECVDSFIAVTSAKGEEK